MAMSFFSARILILNFLPCNTNHICISCSVIIAITLTFLFFLQYLGHVEVDESRGMHICEDAVKRLKAAKGRDENKPFPLMVYNSSQMHQVAFLNEREERIVDKLTPGPLTLVLKKKDVINSEFTSGKDTIAIRIPNDQFVLQRSTEETEECSGKNSSFGVKHTPSNPVSIICWMGA